MYIYIWHHLIYINNVYIYIYFMFIYIDHFIKDFWKHHTSRKPPLFLRHGRHKGGSHNVVPGLAHHFSWRLWRKRKAFVVRLMAAGNPPGNESRNYPTKTGVSREKSSTQTMPGWVGICFSSQEGKWMIGCCGTVEPSIDFSEAKEPLRTDGTLHLF